MTSGGERQRILVAGAGALGLVFGALLRRAGHAVALLGRAVHADAVAMTGVHVEGLWGHHVASGFELATEAAQLRGPFDGILVTVKSYDTRAVGAAVAPLLAADGVVISLQNGLGNVEALGDVVGTQHVLAGRVIFGAETLAPGRVRVTVYADPVLIGVWRAAEHSRLQAAARMWAERLASAGIPSAYSDDIEAALWGKVLYNAALNPLGALLGVHYGALGEDANTRAIMDVVIDEVFRVAIAEGVALPWASAAEYRAVFYGRLVPATFDHRSSMLQDLERGRPTEIDAINGAVWKRGAAHAIVTPANEILTRLVHARGTRTSTTTMKFMVTRTSLAALHAHAREAYPDECCGMIVERDGREEVVRVTNIQNDLHAKDPEQYPRTAATAYTMGLESAAILIAAERGTLTLRAFYHSHPEHQSYFSAEDKKQAMGGWDEPNYPQAAQLVVSVYAREVRDTKAFAWDETARDFVEVILNVAPE